MARYDDRVLKQTSHPFGLPCSTCLRLIVDEEKYTERVLPSEVRAAFCSWCKPVLKLTTGVRSARPVSRHL